MRRFKSSIYGYIYDEASGLREKISSLLRQIRQRR